MLCRTGNWLTLCESRCVNAMRNAIRDRESFWCGVVKCDRYGEG